MLKSKDLVINPMSSPKFGVDIASGDNADFAPPRTNFQKLGLYPRPPPRGPNKLLWAPSGPSRYRTRRRGLRSAACADSSGSGTRQRRLGRNHQGTSRHQSWRITGSPLELISSPNAYKGKERALHELQRRTRRIKWRKRKERRP